MKIKRVHAGHVHMTDGRVVTACGEVKARSAADVRQDMDSITCPKCIARIEECQ